MKKIIKNILPDWFIENIQIRKQKNIFKNKPIKETFTHINESKHWKSEESVSGEGSELAATQALIKGLNNLIKDLNIKSILDIPCGDFNWMQHVDLSGVAYTGADIVERLIEANNVTYATKNMAFKILDLTKDSLPYADLLFCRDCLVHLSYKDIYKALINIKKSKSKYVLTTSFYRCDKNKNIITGQWRKLNFELFPFYFKKPLLVIDEKYTKKGNKYADKSMCLWEVKTIIIPFKLKLYYWFS